jgi:hypothetical protein
MDLDTLVLPKLRISVAIFAVAATGLFFLLGIWAAVVGIHAPSLRYTILSASAFPFTVLLATHSMRGEGLWIASICADALLWVAIFYLSAIRFWPRLEDEPDNSSRRAKRSKRQ